MTGLRRISIACAIMLVGGIGGCSCSDDGPGGTPTDGGVRTDGTTPGTDGTVGPGVDSGPVVSSDAGITITEDGGFTWTCYETSCAGHVTECGDCEDNDMDGVIDSRDRECLGPCDNSEGPALTTGVGGETGGPCKADCYFDYGNGSGNDECYWDHRCDPLSVAPTYDPEGPTCEYEMSRVGMRDCPDVQSDLCYEVCRPLTPAGCDCFGCCTFPEISDRPASEGGTHVWLGSVVEGTNDGTCTFDAITDTTLCRPCTPVGNCYNDCGRCELCIGRTELPPECLTPVDGGTPDVDGGVPLRCEHGEQPCGLPTDPACPPDWYCVSGCCQATLI